MAYVRKKTKKNGDIIFKIEVKYYDSISKCEKTKTKTFIPPKNITESKMNYLVEKEAKDFEKQVTQIVTSNTPQAINDMKTKFKSFAIKWINNAKEEKGITYYEEKVGIVNYLIEELGDYKLTDLKPSIIQDLFNKIDARKKVVTRVWAKENIKDILKEKGISLNVCDNLGICRRTLINMRCGKNISEEWALIFSNVTNIPFDSIFNIDRKITDYARETNSKIKKVLALILGKAVKYGLIDKNYATHEYIDFPKTKRPKIDVMNEEEIKIFYDTILKLDNMSQKTALMIFILTGFRRGEVCALKWSDINFKNQTITISRSARRSKELGVFIKDPKTESSKRTISIPSILVDQLFEYRKYVCDKYRNVDNVISDNSYVFTNQYGGMINIDTFEKWMNKALIKANLPHHTLHSLRHTNVTIQIAAGVPIVTVSSRVGHSKTSTTTDIYAYSLQGSDKKAANAIDNLFKGEKEVCQDVSNNPMDEFKRAKAEMEQYGLNSMKEYIEFKEFMKFRNISITSQEKKDYN